MNVYKPVDIWEKLDGALMRYLCVENLETGKFIVLRSTVYNRDLFSDIKQFRCRLEADSDALLEHLLITVPEDQLEDDEPPKGFDSPKEAVLAWCRKWGP